MKHKVSELEGALLDQAVAKAKGMLYDAAIDRHVRVELARPHEPPVYFSTCQAVIDGVICIYSPSSNWAQGGPIIERERIAIGPRGAAFGSVWAAGLIDNNGIGTATNVGPTSLIAAMRAFVASKFGKEVELP